VVERAGSAISNQGFPAVDVAARGQADAVKDDAITKCGIVRDCSVSHHFSSCSVAHIDVLAYAAAHTQNDVRRTPPVRPLKHVCKSMLEHRFS
jgi:hypothetical protein